VIVFWRVSALLFPGRLRAVAVVDAIGTDTRFCAVYTRHVAIAPQFFVTTAQTRHYWTRSLACIASCVFHVGSMGFDIAAIGVVKVVLLSKSWRGNQE
jgi:hypothetical protein